MMMDAAADHYGFTWVHVIPEEKQWGLVTESGTWNGLIGLSGV